MLSGTAINLKIYGARTIPIIDKNTPDTILNAIDVCIASDRSLNFFAPKYFATITFCSLILPLS